MIKLAQAVKSSASDGVGQIVFYDEGVGSDTNKILGGATGLGIDQNIQDAYRFLCLNYEQVTKSIYSGSVAVLTQ